MRYMRSAIAIAASLWLVGGGIAAAQSTGADKKTTRSEKTAMATGEMIGQHTTQGEITKLDEKKGWVNVKTSEGTMIVHLPPSALQGLKKGDTITVDLAMKNNGKAK